MPTPQETGEQQAQSTPDAEREDTVNLVDYFDQMDRKAFHRALGHRDRPNSIRKITDPER